MNTLGNSSLSFKLISLLDTWRKQVAVSHLSMASNNSSNDKMFLFSVRGAAYAAPNFTIKWSDSHHKTQGELFLLVHSKRNYSLSKLRLAPQKMGPHLLGCEIHRLESEAD